MGFEELKKRQGVMWGSGSYDPITETVADVHGLLVERLAPGPGTRWLDVATGTGAVALRAAGAGAEVTGVDLASDLIETARKHAADEGLDVAFDVGDAEALPYPDANFDVVTSTFGVMFTPDHRATAAQLARVTKPGGRLAVANWTPESGVAEQFRVMAPFQPPAPEGAGVPFDWGRREYVEGLLGDAFELTFEEHDSPLRAASGEAAWDLFVTHYGPTTTLAASLDGERRRALHDAWVAYFASLREGDEVVQHRAYLLALGTRR